jgi:hypothetical protein
MKRRGWLPYVVAGLPLAWYAALLAFAWMASRQVGHWPHYGAPDPKDVWLIAPNDGFGRVMQIAMFLGAPGTIAAAVALGFFTLRALLAERWTPGWRLTGNLASQIVVCALGLALFFAELGKLRMWLAD